MFQCPVCGWINFFGQDEEKTCAKCGFDLSNFAETIWWNKYAKNNKHSEWSNNSDPTQQQESESANNPKWSSGDVEFQGYGIIGGKKK